MKNSFSLLEIILTLIISTIVIIYSSFFTKELIIDNKYNQNIEIAKINILSTKIFFEKHKNELDLINYSNENLYFKGSLLLEKVKTRMLVKIYQEYLVDTDYKFYGDYEPKVGEDLELIRIKRSEARAFVRERESQ